MDVINHNHIGDIHQKQYDDNKTYNDEDDEYEQKLQNDLDTIPYPQVDEEEEDDDDNNKIDFCYTDYRTSKFQAELKFLEAIGKPRKLPVGKGGQIKKDLPKKPWLSREEAEREQRLAPKYDEMSKEELSQFRQQVPANVRAVQSENELEYSRVQTLPRKLEKAISSTGLEKLVKTSKSRQVRHDEAVRNFKDSVIDISEDLEKQVINNGRDLRDSLEQVDLKIEKLIKELQVEDELRKKDYDYVTETWEILNQLCEERKQAIVNFDREMEQVEETRSSLVGAKLRELVDQLVKISYKLRGEVERLVEKEAHEINIVLINNLKLKSDLVARMLKRHVFVYHSTKQSWEKAELRWRNLRHERALVSWENLINSERFTNPEKRNEIIMKMQQEQLDRHKNQRTQLLLELGKLVKEKGFEETLAEQKGDLPPSQLPLLTKERINDIKIQLEKLYEKEGECNKQIQMELEQQQKEMYEEMITTREELRAELHTYAALAEKGDIFTQGARGEGSKHRVKLGEMIGDSDLDDFFRKSGGLKPELVQIVQTLAKPELIHNNYVSELLARVTLLKEACKLSKIMEEEGKTADQRALENTLEKLRVGKKAELAPLVPILFKQAMNLKSTSLSEPVIEELEIVLDHLEQVQPGLKASEETDQQEDLNVKINQQQQKGKTKESNDKQKEGDNDDDDDDDEEKAEGNTIKGDATELAYKEKPLNLVDLRAAQKRLGTIVHTTNLPIEIQQEIGLLFVTLQRQIEINKIIDKVVQEHCNELVEKRNSEVQHEREIVAKHIVHQREKLNVNALNIVEYFLQIAGIVQQGLETVEKTDIYFDTALDNLCDSFEEENGEKEKRFEQTVQHLRHAPDKKQLESLFESSLRILGEIDQGYREYHKQGEKLSKQHPQQAHTEAVQKHEIIATHFGMVHKLSLEEIEDDEVDINNDDEKVDADQGEAHVEEEVDDDDDNNNQNDGVKSVQEEGEETKEEEEEEDTEEGGQDTARETEQDEEEDDDDDEDEVEGGDGDHISEQEMFQPQQVQVPFNYIFIRTKPISDIVSQLLEYKPKKEKKQLDDGVENENSVVEESESEESEQEEAETSSNICTIETDTALVLNILDELQSAVLETTCTARHLREMEMNEICEERCTEFTEELEERLRLHWPRKGRTEVKFKQPRAGELLQHQQRHDRQVRAVVLKNRAQAEQFERKLKMVDQGLKKFRQHMNGLTLHLEAQHNVAALQGIYKRGKEAIVSLQNDMKERKQELLPFVRKTNELLSMNKQFLSACQTFEDGGDYNKEEIKLEEISLSKVEEELLRDIGARAETLQQVFNNIRDCRLKFAKRFQTDFENCLQTLSVREGLGQKYGEPRRNAQEKLRSEVSLSDNAMKYLANSLQDLKTMVTQKTKLINNKHVDEDHTLSEQMKVCVDTIRRCMYKRAVYLDVLRDPAQMVEPKQLYLQDTPFEVLGIEQQQQLQVGEEDLEEEISHEVFKGLKNEEIEIAMGTAGRSTTTFLQAIETANLECQKATRDLYESEGMLDDLNETGKRVYPDGELLPESLVLFLHEFDEKSKSYHEQSCRKFRDQVEKFQEILLEAPRVIIEDLTNRSKTGLITECDDEEKNFLQLFKLAQTAKQGHQEMLRPHLGDPNFANELALLSKSEDDRFNKTTQSILETHVNLIDTIKQCGKDYILCLVNVCDTVLKLLDGCILVDDLKTLPGDELVVTKRMGLKKLRSARMKGQLQKQGDKKSSTSNPDSRGLSKRIWHSLDLEQWNHAKQTVQLDFVDKTATTTTTTTANDDNNESTNDDSESFNEEKEVEMDDTTPQEDHHKIETLKTLESYLTNQHRHTIQARDREYKAYIDWFVKQLKKYDSKYKTLHDEEQEWKNFWETSIRNLTVADTTTH